MSNLVKSRSKSLSIITLLVAFSCSLSSFATVPKEHPGTDQVSVSEDYYRAITFEWTDAQGEKHVSSLVDQATDPNHIVALLQEVYLNPKVPGYIKDVAADKHNDGREPYSQVPYKPCTLAPFNMAEDLTVEKPLNGATALIVEMKETYTDGISDPQKALDAVKSVSLISKQMYIGSVEDGSTNPGFLFNIETSLNKFFIISKGSIRPLETGFPLFYNMYEELSPSNKTPIFGAFDKMDQGEQFPVDHNCSTIIGQRHDIIMSEEGSHDEHAVNLMFYLPDLRFDGETRCKNEGDKFFEHYSFYDKDHQPFFFFNKINAEIDGEVSLIGETRKATVPVSWVSTYKDITRSNVPERFYIYRVVNDVVDNEPIPASDLIMRQDDTQLIDEDGAIIRAATNRVNIYVIEDQDETSRSVRYLIKGHREGSEFSFVESNIVNSLIPGYTAFENLEIVIDGKPESTYDIPAQVNHYRNHINLTDNAGASGNTLLNGHISVRKGDQPGTRFELRRYLPGSDKYTLVATMEVTSQEPNKTWGSVSDPHGVHVYDATITYPEGVDSSDLPKTARFKSEMDVLHPENDVFKPIRAVDGANGVLAAFVDKFDASTALGDQPTGYTYRIVYEAASDIVPGTSGKSATSNAVSVSVPVRHLTVGYVPYSEDQVLNDIDAANRLPLNPVGVAIMTKQNPAVSGYEIFNVTKGYVVARAIRSPSGIFERVVYNDNGVADRSLNPATKEAYSGRLSFQLNSTADVDDVFALTIQYDNGNTYGNIYSKLTPRPRVVITDSNFTFSKLESGQSATYDADLAWGSENLSVSPWPHLANNEQSYSVYGYNVWGQHSGIDQFELISDLNYVQPFSYQGYRTLSHSVSAHLATDENPVNLDHIVRLYAAVPDQMLIADKNVTNGYLVNDEQTHSKFDGADLDHATGIEDVAVDQIMNKAKYFDLQGHRVYNPTAGMYIRVVGDKAEKIIID